MAGQVDIIISKAAIAEIADATAKLETLRLKILDVNKAGAKPTMSGIQNNDKIVAELQAINKVISANKNLISTKKRAVKVYEGTARALTIEINKLKKEQQTLTTSNKSWLQYQMRIMKVQGKLRQLTATHSQVSMATRKTATATKGFGKSLGGVGNLLKGGGILFALNRLKDLAIQLVRNVFNLAKTFDSLRFALERTSSSFQEARMNSLFMLNLSNDLGLSLVATTTRFIKFAAAARNSGLAMKDTQKIFGTMAKAGAVLGLRTDELSGVFLALEQMLSKGKVTTEELRRQLGERLPGAFGIMAASLGVTLPKLDKMLKAGEILSAEVLPGFADAVEVAFGLDTVNKVDTLVAAENRLTTGWQNFVKNLTAEGSVIKGFFKSILVSGNEFVNHLNAIFNRVEFFNKENMQFGFDQQTEIITRLASEQLEKTKKDGAKLTDLEANITKARLDLVGNLKNKDLVENQRVAVAALLSYNKELRAIEQKEAESRFAAEFVAFSEQKAKVEKLKAALKIKDFETREESSSGNFAIDLFKKFVPVSKAQIELAKDRKELEEATLRLNQAEGKLSATRLLAESSRMPEKELNDLTKSALTELSNLKGDALIAQLQTEIKINEDKLENENNTNKKILELASSNYQKESIIAGIQAEEKIEKAKQTSISLIEEAKNYGLKGIALTDRLDEIEENRSNKQIKAEQNKTKKLVEIRAKYLSRIEKQVKDNAKSLELKQDGILSNQLIDLRTAYLEEVKVTKDKKKLTEDYLFKKGNLEIESFNLVIGLRIAEQEALAALDDGNTKYTKGLSDRIAKLKAGLKIPKVEEGVGGAKKELTEQEQFELNMEYASKYADAMTNIGSALFDRKISDIDAELEASRLKYDELFILAQGDAKQTRLLKIQEAKDIEKLEAKKLKLMRRKAILEKANSLISIAINTAVTASKTLATTGLVFGLPLLPAVYALGALQAAAVLAQPLPKFAKGGVMGHDGLAVVGDGGRQEVIRTPDGKVSLTPDTDTVVNLQKGTEIFSSVDKFNQENPSQMSGMLHSASLLASISLSQKNIDGMMTGQRELDERLLDAMLLNTKAVKNSKSNTFVKTERIDIAHELWKSKLLN